MFVRMKSSCFITNIRQIFLFYAEIALKMRKMRMLKNCADPYHRILSDALHSIEVLVVRESQHRVLCLQQMLADKLRCTDWEATNEAMEEAVARESYLEWLRDREKRARGTKALVWIEG